jgi:hypothetical protein
LGLNDASTAAMAACVGGSGLTGAPTIGALLLA